MGSRFVVVGGAGQIGRLFVELFAARGDVVVVDPAARPDGTGRVLCHRIDEPAPEIRAALAAADTVLLALPETVAVDLVPVVADAMRAGALLVDTLSVKEKVVAALAESARRCGLLACSLNPMFAPALGVAGRPVAAVRVTPGDRVDDLLALLAAAGARLVEVTAEEHDRLTAVLQVATHASVLAFGDAVVASGLDVDTLLGLAPPPHLTMLALLARIVTGQPDVYWDIQAGSEHAAAARDALRTGLRKLDQWVTDRDAAGFRAAFDHIGHHLDGHRDDLAGRCAELFSRQELRTPDPRMAT